jgi:hypothetical protein
MTTEQRCDEEDRLECGGTSRLLSVLDRPVFLSEVASYDTATDRGVESLTQIEGAVAPNQIRGFVDNWE